MVEIISQDKIENTGDAKQIDAIEQMNFSSNEQIKIGNFFDAKQSTNETTSVSGFRTGKKTGAGS